MLALIVLLQCTSLFAVLYVLVATHYHIPSCLRYALEMCEESRFVCFLMKYSAMLHIVGCRRVRVVEWCLNHIHCMNYAEVINMK